MNDDIILEEEAIAEERAAEMVQLGAAIMRKPIRAVTTLKEPICVAPDSELRIAIEKMNESRVGCVLIVEGGRLVGVFTERDVLNRVVLRNLNVRQARVEEVMTRDPECLTLDDGIAYALNKMSVGGFRHIPLVDELGRPTAVVAMRNIVDYIVDLFPTEILNLPPEPSLEFARSREGA